MTWIAWMSSPRMVNTSRPASWRPVKASTAGWPPAGRDKRRALAPEAQQVPRDAFRAFKDPGEFGDPRPEVDIAPGIRGQYAEQAAEVAV
jgi:hypothetical protein